MIPESGKGVTAVLVAAVVWGISPIFYKALSHVPALNVMSHRMIWSLVFFAVVLGFQGRLREIPLALKDRRSAGLLLLASVIIAVNWALFIWAIQVGLTTQSSLGYYIYPLISVLFGRLFFAEALTKQQWLAIGIVTAAVTILTLGVGSLPWVALLLATTCAGYGVLKKQLELGPVLSVTIEVMLLSPVAALLLIVSAVQGIPLFGGDIGTFALLVMAGPMTAVPLILFGYGTKRMKMASVGLMLYVNPTIQFACAVFLFSEPFSPYHLGAFVMIWVALGLYSASSLRNRTDLAIREQRSSG